MRYFLNISRMAKKHGGHLWQPREVPLIIVSEMVDRGFLTREKVFATTHFPHFPMMQRYTLTAFGAAQVRCRA